MRRIVASTFVTLDGVMEAPGSGDNSLPEHRGWSEPFMTPELGQLIFAQLDASDALLLGRITYQGFAAFWPSIPDDDPFALRMNSMTKYVVSTSLDRADWQNSQLIQGQVAQEIAKLKEQPGGTISITGSGMLIRSLVDEDLIDEIQLCVCPVILGVGKRLFDHSSKKKVLQLADTRTFSAGMVLLTYRRDGAA